MINLSDMVGVLLQSGMSKSTTSRARNALAHLVVEGVHTTVDFLEEVVRDDEFRTGNVDTGFLDRYFERRTGADEG